MISQRLFTSTMGNRSVNFPAEKLTIPPVSQPATERQNTMGDKSPKSTNKKAAQKQAKNNASANKKKQAAAAKSSAGKK